jgi:hypothetical protein
MIGKLHLQKQAPSHHKIDPASATIMTRHHLFYNPAILAIINQQDLHLQAG